MVAGYDAPRDAAEDDGAPVHFKERAPQTVGLDADLDTPDFVDAAVDAIVVVPIQENEFTCDGTLLREATPGLEHETNLRPICFDWAA